MGCECEFAGDRVERERAGPCHPSGAYRHEIDVRERVYGQDGKRTRLGGGLGVCDFPDYRENPAGLRYMERIHKNLSGLVMRVLNKGRTLVVVGTRNGNNLLYSSRARPGKDRVMDQ